MYLDNPKVSGNNLVGLRWKSAQARFDPDGVHIERAAAAPFGKVCVEVMSKDGRYDAENTYDLGLNASPDPGFKSATRYVEQLGSYAPENVSIIVHGQPCGTVALPPLIPAFLASSRDPHPASRELTAFLNADPNRISATLVDPGGSGLLFACVSAGTGVQIAYAAECTVAVPSNVHGELILRVAQRERFKTVATDYRVRLP